MSWANTSDGSHTHPISQLKFEAPTRDAKFLNVENKGKQVNYHWRDRDHIFLDGLYFINELQLTDKVKFWPDG